MIENFNDDPDRIFINDDKRLNNLEVLGGYISNYNKLTFLNFESLAKLVDDMGSSLVYDLKNMYNVKNYLEQYPDATRIKLLKKILYNPFYPLIFRKIAEDSLFDFTSKILHRREDRFLSERSWDKEFIFNTFDTLHPHLTRTSSSGNFNLISLFFVYSNPSF